MAERPKAPIPVIVSACAAVVALLVGTLKVHEWPQIIARALPVVIIGCVLAGFVAGAFSWWTFRIGVDRARKLHDTARAKETEAELREWTPTKAVKLAVGAQAPPGFKACLLYGKEGATLQVTLFAANVAPFPVSIIETIVSWQADVKGVTVSGTSKHKYEGTGRPLKMQSQETVTLVLPENSPTRIVDPSEVVQAKITSGVAVLRANPWTKDESLDFFGSVVVPVERVS
jgi:hypothetical protein